MKYQSEREFAQFVTQLGGVLWLVGGAVRDEVMGKAPHDKDYMITGVPIASLPFDRIAGRDFPVFRVEVGSNTCEIALARRERKAGKGHHAFTVFTDEEITVEDDLLRRDLTVNSMAKDVLSGKILDPFGGRKDVENKILRHTSVAFAEDPLRVFRVARFAATLGFKVAPDTIALMSAMKPEVYHLPGERVWKELEKALECEQPSWFFEVLKAASVLDVFFREVQALDVPDKHDVTAFAHTMKVMDAGQSTLERFALLVHDLGKGMTPKEFHPAHNRHDELGETPVLALCQRLRAPKIFEKIGVLSATQHMRAKRAAVMKAGKFFRWVSMHRAYINHILRVSFLDSVYREGANYDREMARFESAQRLVLHVFDVEKTVTGKVLKAEGFKSGRRFGDILFQRRVEVFKRRCMAAA